MIGICSPFSPCLCLRFLRLRSDGASAAALQHLLCLLGLHRHKLALKENRQQRQHLSLPPHYWRWRRRCDDLRLLLQQQTPLVFLALLLLLSHFNRHLPDTHAAPASSGYVSFSVPPARAAFCCGRCQKQLTAAATTACRCASLLQHVLQGVCRGCPLLILLPATSNKQPRHCCRQLLPVARTTPTAAPCVQGQHLPARTQSSAETQQYMSVGS